ncbi:MAG: redoxin domain-containing protein [Anaerolineaceae bacterium]|nr:redoxin domain-containing protein [Anaerolineaceae bacterium]
MKHWRLWLLGILVVVLLAGFPVAAQDGERSPFEGYPQFPAPDFPAGLAWLNVPAPLDIHALQGKIVLLDFWTYGCINCIHMIPVIEQLEDKYGDSLVVIGVHSAKFANEGETENIRQIVQRYGLRHPVINDNEFRVWNTYSPYGVNAWPTFVVIDPLGNLLAVQAGEIPFSSFDQLIGGMVEYWRGRGELSDTPLQLALESASRPNTALAFPGKVLADAAGSRLFIADSNHNRIVIADLNTYEVLDVVGNGGRGLTDGSFSAATFDKPQGMALAGSTLYVADTYNHAIRAIDLLNRTVTTIAGTGEQSYSREGGDALTTGLNSPWALALGADNVLYIAMAGMHQIWDLRLDDGVVAPLIGNGGEGIVDGAFGGAQLAQPSGLYLADGQLYFADSESSSIRVADLDTGEVDTLAGPVRNDLFSFGDVDGVFGVSQLQHALGVTGGADGLLYVADTYNSKIKVLDPAERRITTLFGLSGNGGYRDGGTDEAQFDEPGGLSYANGKLYVADTNNQVIRVIDLETNTVSTVTFPNPEALLVDGEAAVVAANSALGEQVTLPAQTIAVGDGGIVLNILLPEGYQLNDLAPFTSIWSVDGDAIQIAAENTTQSIIEPELPVVVPVTLTEGRATLHGDLTIYYCEKVNLDLCFIDQVQVSIPVVVTADSDDTTIHIDREIIPPVVQTNAG